MRGIQAGLREVARRRATASPPAAPVVHPARDPAGRIVDAMLAAQHESSNAVGFELAVTKAFAFLGFLAQRVGGSGQTDVILDAPVTGTPYRVIVEVKSNKHGKVSDGSIDWPALSDHQRAVSADHILVVAPGFGAGRLLKRANDYGVSLLTGEELAELVRVHNEAPCSLLELRPIFMTAGRASTAISELRLTVDANRARWRLFREIVELVQSRDEPGEYLDAREIWLLLPRQAKPSVPSREDVADAVSVLASRAVGTLKVNCNGRFILTMQVETALRRLQALARLANDVTPSDTQSVPGIQPLPKV